MGIAHGTAEGRGFRGELNFERASCAGTQVKLAVNDVASCEAHRFDAVAIGQIVNRDVVDGGSDAAQLEGAILDVRDILQASSVERFECHLKGLCEQRIVQFYDTRDFSAGT